MSKITLKKFASTYLLKRNCEVERGEIWFKISSKYGSLSRHINLSSKIYSLIYYSFFGVIFNNLKRWRFNTFVTRDPSESYRAITFPHIFSLGRPYTVSYTDLDSLIDTSIELKGAVSPNFRPFYFFLPPFHIPTSLLPRVVDSLESVSAILAIPIRKILAYKLLYFSYAFSMLRGTNLFPIYRFNNQ